jgi:hypothetical protein
MKPVDTCSNKEEERGRGRTKGVNATKIYFKHICKYHNVSHLQLFMLIKSLKMIKM